MGTDLELKAKIQVTKILNKRSVVIKSLGIEVGDVLEISLDLSHAPWSGDAWYADIKNLRTELTKENFSLIKFARGIDHIIEYTNF